MDKLEWNRANNQVMNEQMVPPFLRDHCQAPQSMEMKIRYDATTRKTTYTFSLTWEDEKGTEDNYARRDKPLAPRTVCDGPCGRIFPSHQLHSIGRCGHELCEACNGIVKNSDGTNGCSSLHCNWNGKDRRETRRNFEKEVCRKQRKHAFELMSRGFPVVPASAVNSCSSSGKSSRESASSSKKSKKSEKQSKKSEKPQSSKKLKRRLPGPFQLTYPSKDQFIGVKLVVAEPADTFGIFHTTARIQAMSSIRMLKVLRHMLKKRHRCPYITPASGDLYYAELQPDNTRQLRKINLARLEKFRLYEFPMINEYVIFVLDMGEFVKQRVAIFYV